MQWFYVAPTGETTDLEFPTGPTAFYPYRATPRAECGWLTAWTYGCIELFCKAVEPLGDHRRLLGKAERSSYRTNTNLTLRSLDLS